MNLKSIICALAAICAGALASNAQTKIPADPQFRTGRLPSGMTYYVVHNENPAGCADFYILHNVGALQEEDNQNGLAHFLEHMAFNGTRHFKGRELLEFLASEGVAFGYNVNAYTSKNETVYNISSVPLVRESFVDSVLTVLHDWSCDISCEQDALDAERGVISEEWRRRDDSRTRMAERQNELLYKGSKHVKRSVIGTLEVINGFKREEILDFYHKWYRPDLQAIVVVGDFDAEKMEEAVKAKFSDIPAAVNPVPKERYIVPTLKDTLFANMLDDEIKYYTLKVMHKCPFPEWEMRSTEEYVKDMLLRGIASEMVEARFKQAAKDRSCPAKSVVLVSSPSMTDFYLSLFTISPKSKEQMLPALEFYTREMKSVLCNGFTEDEFENARFAIQRKYKLDKQIYEHDVTDKVLVNICKENFLRGFPCISPVTQQDIQRRMLAEIDFAQACGMVDYMFRDSEKIYSWSENSANADKLPTPEQCRKAIAKAQAEDVAPDHVIYPKPDTSFAPVRGKVVSVKKGKSFGGEIWTLSNGAKVYWTPSEPVKSNVHMDMRIHFAGGYNNLPQESVTKSRATIGYMLRNAGFHGISRETIRNNATFAGVDMLMDVYSSHASMNISSDAKSVETAFRMACLQLSEPYFGEQAELDRHIRQSLSSLANPDKNMTRFHKHVTRLQTGQHPWLEEIDSAAVSAISLPFVEETYERLYGKRSDMKIFICSDLSPELVRSMVEKYIAGLDDKGSYARASVRPLLPEFKGRTVVDSTFATRGEPKSEVVFTYLGNLPRKAANDIGMKLLDYMLSDRYIVRIREERGGTYHVSYATSRHETSPKGLYDATVQFQTRPEMTDVLVGDVEDVMAEFCKTGPTREEMSAAVKYIAKRNAEKEATGRNSLSHKNMKVISHVQYGQPHSYDYNKAIQGISAAKIRSLARRTASGPLFVAIYRERPEL